MKKLVKLTENDLHKVIRESVKRVLKEANYSDNDITYGMWNNIVEQLGADKVLNIIVNNSTTEQLNQWIQLAQEDANSSVDFNNQEW